MKIIDISKRVDLPKYRKRKGKIKGIALHRCGIDLKWKTSIGSNGLEVCASFEGGHPGASRVTGGKRPYTYIIDAVGRIWWCLPWDIVGPHARRQASNSHIGVAVIADPRFEPMTTKQETALIWLLSRLRIAHGLRKEAVRGHGEIPGSHDGSKASGMPNACPGLSAAALRDLRGAVDAECREWGRLALVA